jgi:hypothetical protein
VAFKANHQARIVGQHPGVLIELSMSVPTHNRLVKIKVKDTLKTARAGRCIHGIIRQNNPSALNHWLDGLDFNHFRNRLGFYRRFNDGFRRWLARTGAPTHDKQ